MPGTPFAFICQTPSRSGCGAYVTVIHTQGAFGRAEKPAALTPHSVAETGLPFSECSIKNVSETRLHHSNKIQLIACCLLRATFTSLIISDVFAPAPFPHFHKRVTLRCLVPCITSTFLPRALLEGRLALHPSRNSADERN